MFGVADYGAFVIAILIFLLIPGPGNLALITSTTKGGIRGGVAAIGGLIAGDQVLLWLAVAGVATLLTTYPTAFHAVQWLGAAYLAWLGFKMLLAKPGAVPILNIRAGQYARQALLITLLNPKAIVFYMGNTTIFLNPEPFSPDMFLVFNRNSRLNPFPDFSSIFKISRCLLVQTI